jgi:carbon-monoxide dehydrogenase medium subunit
MKFPKEMTRTIKEFKYFDACEVDEAVSVLGKLGKSAKILAGGTDLLNLMKLRKVVPEFVINIKNNKDLEYIHENEGLKIGALTKISAIRESQIIKRGYMSLFDAAEWFGTPQIRNMATVGGNVCRSSPSSDMIAPLMALDAKLKLVGPNGEREVSVEEFLVGAGKNILDREILTDIFVPHQDKPFGTAFVKLRRSSADLAKVSCSTRITFKDGICDDIRIVLGAVADRVFRAKEAEEIIRGEKVTDKAIEKAAEIASHTARPITDVRSTSAYRKEVVKVLVRRLMNLSLERAKKKSSD